MKLEITKEKVLEAASKCNTAKQTLQVLFPEAFEKPAHEPRIGDVFVREGWAPICLVKAHYAKDAYIFIGDTSYMCYSNNEYQTSMTMTQVKEHIKNDKREFSHNIRDNIVQLIRRDN